MYLWIIFVKDASSKLLYSRLDDVVELDNVVELGDVVGLVEELVDELL